MAWFWFCCFALMTIWSAFLMHLLDKSQDDVRAFAKDGRPIPGLDALLDVTKEETDSLRY